MDQSEQGREHLSLGTWSVSEDGLRFTQAVELTRARFDSLAQDMVSMAQCSTSLHFHALLHSRASWDGLITALNSRRRKQPHRREFTPGNRIVQQRFLVSLANVLSGARAYFDATSYLLSATFGRDAQLVEDFKSSRREQYDSTPPYRFCEQLRNAMQHTASLPLRIQMAGAGDGRTSHRLVAARDQLLQCSFRWKAQVRADIETGPEEIDIARVLDTYLQCIVTIEQQRVVRQIAYQRPALERLLDAYQEAGLAVDSPAVLLQTRSETSGVIQMTPHFGPLRPAIERYLELERDGRLSEVFTSADTPSLDGNLDGTVPVTPEADAVLRAWLLGGPIEASRAIAECLRTPQAASEAIVGLVNLAGVAMCRVEAVLGLSALETLESMTSMESQ